MRTIIVSSDFLKKLDFFVTDPSRGCFMKGGGDHLGRSWVVTILPSILNNQIDPP